MTIHLNPDLATASSCALTEVIAIRKTKKTKIKYFLLNMNSPTININSYSNDCIKIYDIFMKFRCVFRNPNQHMDSTKKQKISEN